MLYCSFLRRLLIITMATVTAAKVVVITGASRGIGLGLAKAFSSKGYCVFPTCRSASPELAAVNLNGGMIVNGVDVATDSGLEKLQTGLMNVNTIDILINNSGILR